MFAAEGAGPYGGEGRTSLDHFQGIQRQLDGDIYSTNAEIRTLNNKIVK